MSDARDSPPVRGRRLVSIFDSLPPDVPVSLAALDMLMIEDTERRIIATLDRVLTALHEPQPPEPAEPS